MVDRLPVVRGSTFLESARRLFPIGGDVDGRPSFGLFEEILLPICEQRFATGFDDLALADPEGPVRIVMTHALSFFPPLVVYGMLVIGSPSRYVELIGLDVDEEYFDTIELDPDD